MQSNSHTSAGMLAKYTLEGSQPLPVRFYAVVSLSFQNDVP